MKGIVGIVAVLAMLGLALAFTKPTEADFEAALEAQLLERIDAADPEATADPVEALLTATCKMGREECARIIRSLISLDYEDRVLYSRARVSLGEEAGASCTGVLTRIFCSEF
ncbi:hypothetical protein SAMN05444722_3509 [Rhodovulum sp. ES.010]|uniref:hypothetical protein n=1 Tax=Rhodovulum sp. ES.010 TaxID=1882821 RepID=UPI0009271FE6|nr:hypothetical protein [Rhodovulum sp. ES.010]SIO55553.1 hypothetical protein SAMN05444722_3509 [Rhodovulum sp. ES.010]